MSKKASRYNIVRKHVLTGETKHGPHYDYGFSVYEGDTKISDHLSHSNAEAAVIRYEAADKRRESK